MNSQIKALPAVLTIAGSDSGGGAGIQADLNTFAALGVHGTTAITCLTAQNPKGVEAIQAATPALVRQQIGAVLDELKPKAVKTGMLFSAAIVDAVVDAFQDLRGLPLIVDPVMVSTSGAVLLRPAAARALTRRLFPLATLVTPNLDETQLLTGRRPADPESLRAAARRMHQMFGCAVLAKGGHLRGMKEALDIFFDGRTELMLTAPFVRGVSTHGTGCTYSAAIAAWCARGCALPEAVYRAKRFITAAIARSSHVARHCVLNWAVAGRLSRRR